MTKGSCRLAAVVFALTEPLSGAAQPIVDVHVEGACSSEQALDKALARWATVSSTGDAPRWKLAVQALSPTQVVMELRTPGGEVSIRRELPSRDCSALAAAIDVIARTHFVELHLVPPEPSVLPAVVPAEEPTSVTSTTVREESPAPVAVPDPPPPRRSFALVVALSGGADLAYAPALFAGNGQADATLEASPFGVRLSWSYASATEQSRGTDVIEHQEWRLFSHALLRFGGSAFWMVAGIGPGLVHTSAEVTSMDATPAASSTHPAVGALLDAGLRLAGPLALRFEAAGNVRFYRDRYFIRPDLVARSPRGTVSLNAGLEVRLNL